MAKYRALVDIPPNVKQGDVVTLTEEPVPGMKERLVAVGDDEKVTDTTGNISLEGNVSREALKLRADELNLDYASNISTAKLLELVKEAQEAKAAELAAANGDGGETDKDEE